jgi:hypothetical protein
LRCRANTALAVPINLKYIGESGNGFLAAAIMRRNVDLIQWILSTVDGDLSEYSTAATGESLLVLACEMGLVNVALQLVHRSPPNPRDRFAGAFDFNPTAHLMLLCYSTRAYLAAFNAGYTKVVQGLGEAGVSAYEAIARLQEFADADRTNEALTFNVILFKDLVSYRL